MSMFGLYVLGAKKTSRSVISENPWGVGGGQTLVNFFFNICTPNNLIWEKIRRWGYGASSPSPFLLQAQAASLKTRLHQPETKIM